MTWLFRDILFPFHRKQLASQRRPRSKKSGTNRVHRHLHQLGNLRVTQLLVFPQHENLPLLRTELLQGLTYPQAGLAVWLYSAVCLSRRRAPSFCLLTPLSRQRLERDPVEVSPHQRSRFISRNPSNHRQERFLGQVFGALLAIQPPPKETEERFPVSSEKLFKRGARAALELKHHLLIAVHSCSSCSIPLMSPSFEKFPYPSTNLVPVR